MLIGKSKGNNELCLIKSGKQRSEITSCLEGGQRDWPSGCLGEEMKTKGVRNLLGVEEGVVVGWSWEKLEVKDDGGSRLCGN
jgi:hypothetical protein